MLIRQIAELRSADIDIQRPKVVKNTELTAHVDRGYLGFGVTIGGKRDDVTFGVIATQWLDHVTSGTRVKSGWLYIAEETIGHAIAFFKLHVYNNNNGYIHIVDVAHPAHIIWLSTETGFYREKEFHFVEHRTDIWRFE